MQTLKTLGFGMSPTNHTYCTRTRLRTGWAGRLRNTVSGSNPSENRRQMQLWAKRTLRQLANSGVSMHNANGQLLARLNYQAVCGYTEAKLIRQYHSIISHLYPGAMLHLSVLNPHGITYVTP